MDLTEISRFFFLPVMSAARVLTHIRGQMKYPLFIDSVTLYCGLSLQDLFGSLCIDIENWPHLLNLI